MAPFDAELQRAFTGIQETHAPLAEAVNDRPARGVQRVPHGLAGFFGVGRAVRAPVVFQIIDAPRGVGARILELVAPAARKSGTGARARAVVEINITSIKVFFLIGSPFLMGGVLKSHPELVSGSPVFQNEVSETKPVLSEEQDSE